MLADRCKRAVYVCAAVFGNFTKGAGRGRGEGGGRLCGERGREREREGGREKLEAKRHKKN